MHTKAIKIIAKKLLAFLLIMALMPQFPQQNIEVSAKMKPLPFSLVAPKHTALTWLNGNDSPTTMKFSYSMENDMCSIFDLKEKDEDAYKAKLQECDFDEMWVKLQVDWAIDDSVNGWHYTEYWDTEGYDSEFNKHTGPWDELGADIGTKTVNNVWIMRDIYDLENNSEWNGDSYFAGLKNQLASGQYTTPIDEYDQSYVAIDYNNHTIYARARYMVTMRKNDGETDDWSVFSDWSPVAAYGKDAPIWNPSTDINAPAVSELRLSGETFNGVATAYVKQEITDNLKQQLVNIDVNDGYIFFEMEGRVKDGQWKSIAGERDIKNGDMEIPLSYLQEQNRTIKKGTPIEFRFRYCCSIHNATNHEETDYYYTAYSNILTLNNVEIKASGKEESSGGNQNTSVVKPEPAITSLTSGASDNQVSKYIIALKDDKDPKGTTFGFLFAKQKKVKNNSITIKWKKPKNASRFVVYGAKCGKANRYQRIKSVTGTSFTQSGLNKGTYYKYLVAAFDKNDKLLGVANTLHIATKGGKVCNFKKVTTAAKKNKVVLKKKGKTFKLKGKAVKESKKLKVKVHRGVRYESSNKKIATVDKSGKVKVVKKGTCYVYVYAQNGAYQKVKITVKK